MRQIIQSLRTGETQLVEVPCPQVRTGCLLIQTTTTLISAGTERMLQEFGKAGWLGKARQQPEKVRQVLDKVRTDGLFATFEAVTDKLDQPIPLGYCNVGRVLEVGSGVTGFAVGDRVLSNGGHAEIVSVPRNLGVRVPDAVPDEDAVFGVLGAIALQGIRLLEPTLGECAVVSGLGLVGLLAVQLLQAHGARVLGADFNPARLQLAAELGVETCHLGEEDLAARANVFSRGRGVDAVLIAAATSSDDPIRQATEICRKRGRIVLTGVAGMSLSRDEFFKKELSFQVSCSYGPGRYDSEYEEAGRDYPVPYVRWTEQRNFEAVLDMLGAGRITARPLVSHRFALGNATAAYTLIGSREPSLGVLLDYPAAAEEEVRQTTIRFAARAKHIADRRPSTAGQTPVIGFIGAGGFASRMLLPAFKAEGARLKWVGTRSGLSGAQAARKFGIERATTDTEQILADPETNAVVIATRHDSHATLICRALAAGKHVFVEKPLAVNADQLGQVEAAVAAASRASQVLVGFNRRFAPQVGKMASLLRGVDEPKSFIATVNAGAIPADHWTQHPEQGGGRLIGEGCHFLDLLRHLCGHAITGVHAVQLGGRRPGMVCDDKVSVSLTFADGSFGVVHYLANGHRAYPKERIEVFCGERVLQLDNFRRLSGWGWPGFSRMNLWRQDKGHRAEVAAFLAALRSGGPMPIPFHELVEVTRASFAAVESATTGQPVSLIPSAAEPLRFAA